MSVLDAGEQYNGALDVENQRHGIGNCKWSNGDYYEGDWKNNLRHGNGKFTEEGFEYIG